MAMTPKASTTPDRTGSNTLPIFTEIEDVLTHVGRYGRAQIAILILLSVEFTASLVNFLLGVFLLQSPTWSCREGYNCSWTKDPCELHEGHWSWDNKDGFMISYFGLECDRSYATLAASLFFIPGAVAGLIVFGFVSDRFGRRVATATALISSLIVGIGQAVASNFELFLVLRTLNGFCCIGFQANYVTFRNEYFPSSARPTVSFVGACFKISGLFIMSGISYLFEWWRAIPIAYCILVAICLLGLFVPETPQWLLVNRSPQAAADVLFQVAKINGSPLQASQIRLKTPGSTKKSGNILEIIKNRSHLLVTLNFCYQWFIVSLMFYGFYFGLEAISGSFNANFAIMASLEVPFYIFNTILLGVIGRRKALLLAQIIIIVNCILTFIPLKFTADWNLKRVATLVGSKAGVTICFFILYLFTNETMPTTVRSTGLNTCSFFARIGSFLAPFVVRASEQAGPYTQNLVFLGLTVVGVALVSILPDTKNTALRSKTFVGDRDEGEGQENKVPSSRIS